MTQVQPQSKPESSIDAAEVGRFAALAQEWWDPEGKFKPLHRFNPARLDYARDHLARHFGRALTAESPFAGLSLVDIGCGGGLASEPMARLGFRVTGIDAGPAAIDIAREHAAASGLPIDYRVATAEQLAEEGAQFDAALALEIVEHVADRDAFFAALGLLVRPGGILIGATLNRTARSFALGIVAAEYVLGWVPRGTHDWRRFPRPSELVLGLRRAGFGTTRLAGLTYDPPNGWSVSGDLSVNYVLTAVRR